MKQLNQKTILKEALEYARRKIPVFPCKPDKSPYTRRGFRDASTNPEQIKEWWEKWPDAIIGMPTHKASYLVLDVDLPDGPASLAALEAEFGPLPVTREVKTRSGGRHLYFKYMSGIKNSVGKLGKNLDIRTEGGYVIVPPSPGYTWVDEREAATLPDWIAKKLRKVERTKPKAAPQHVFDLKEMCTEMLQTPEGSRNDKLNSLAYRIGIMVGNGEVPESYLDVLIEAALDSGLHIEEVERTSRSGFAAGLDAAINSVDSGFLLWEDGIYHSDDFEKIEPKRVAPPLEVLAHTRDESSDRWGLWVRWKDPDGKEHNKTLPLTMLMENNTPTLLSVLADGGYIIDSPKLFNLYLKSFKTNRRAVSVDRTGWHGSAFVFPDTVLYVGNSNEVGTHIDASDSSPPQEDVPVVMSEAELIVLQTQNPDNPYKTGGTLEGWQQTVGAWAEGNSRLLLALCAAFAAPLTYFIDHENFGFNITGKSSSGKSTALLAAASIWGKGATGQDGYARSWHSTGNGLEGVACSHNNTLLALDEMGQALARTVSDAAYMLATRSKIYKHLEQVFSHIM